MYYYQKEDKWQPKLVIWQLALVEIFQLAHRPFLSVHFILIKPEVTRSLVRK